MLKNGWQYSKWLAKIIVALFIAANAFLIFNISLSYYLPDFTKGFLASKIDIFYTTIYRYAFYAHISVSPLILVSGILQFSGRIRGRFSRFHKTAGKLYVFLILFVSAPSGAVMGYYAMGGWWVKSAFIILAVLWWWFTFVAYKKIRQQNIAAHQRFMQRSYLLTLSAIFLRLYYYLLVAVFNVAGSGTYLFVSWACWLPHILLLEGYWLLFSSKKLTLS